VGRGPKAERTAILVRLDPRLVEALKASADQDMRSLNAQVEVLLREALARRGRKVPPPETA